LSDFSHIVCTHTHEHATCAHTDTERDLNNDKNYFDQTPV